MGYCLICKPDTNDWLNLFKIHTVLNINQATQARTALCMTKIILKKFAFINTVLPIRGIAFHAARFSFEVFNCKGQRLFQKTRSVSRLGPFQELLELKEISKNALLIVKVTSLDNTYFVLDR